MRLTLAAGLAWLSVSSLALASQIPFGSSYLSSNDGFDDKRRIELPLEADAQGSLHSRSVEETIAAENGKHVVLTHKDFPQMSVRIKKMGAKSKTADEMMDKSGSYNHSDPRAFCDPTVNSWSGYVDLIDGKSLFFYFFESRSNPSKDPVLMWLNGGPGCSSQLGLFMELGPCRVPLRNGTLSEGPPINGTEWNPYSWNTGTSLIVLDQPVNVGFSYSQRGVDTFDSDQGSKDVYAFLRVFFSSFDKFQGNEFIIAGESYGGRYVPRYASQVIDENHKIRNKAERSGKKVNKAELINLKKIAVGNGLTDVAVQIPSYFDFTCTRKGGVEPVLSIETCKDLHPWKNKCLKWIKEQCRDTYNKEQCDVAVGVCVGMLQGAYSDTKLNPYNIKDQCKAGLSPNLCYDVVADIRTYLDRDDVRELVGAEPVSSIGKVNLCNSKVGNGFNQASDANTQGADSVSGLLERGVEVMIYVGKLDWICNWVGNRVWVDHMDWTDREEFHKNKLETFVVDGKDAGQAQTGGGLTWVTIENAGHMVPYDKPKAALQMLTRFLNGEKL